MGVEKSEASWVKQNMSSGATNQFAPTGSEVAAP